MSKKKTYGLYFGGLALAFLSLAFQFKSTADLTLDQPSDNKYRLISTSDSGIADLSYLDTLLKDKSIVMLGESAHGVEEFSSLKYRIIKRLHEKLGFNVLAFESGISECAFLDEMKEKLNSKELLEKGIVQVWQTQTNLKLIDYIKANKIKVVGFDNQISTDCNSEFLKISISKFDKVLADKIYRLDTAAYKLYFNKSKSKQIQTEDASRFDKLKAEILKEYSSACLKTDSLLKLDSKNISRSSMLTLKKVLQNKIYLSQTYFNSKKLSGQRDSIMFFNLKWLVDTLAPNEKIIVWAHNSHISKTGDQNEKSYMGKLTSDFYGNRIYGIGLYAYKGKVMDVWRRGKFTISDPDSNSLEKYLHINDLANAATFLNFTSGPPVKNSVWTTQQVKAYSWGVRETFIVPRDEYNGVISVNLATTPKYIN